MEERPPQKRDLIFRSSSIDTSTPRLQPDHRRQPSFSSPTYSPAVSPSYSDHSTSRGFYSPRGGEDDDEDSDGVDCIDEDERGYLYRPRSPEIPVISTVSRSVRLVPKVVTRVKDGEFVERRVVEEDGGGGGGGRGSVRRKWEGRNTVVYDSGLKEKAVVRGLRVVEEEGSEEFRDRKLFEFIAKEKEAVEEKSVDLAGRRGRSNTFVSDSGVKERNEVTRDRRGRKSNAFESESGVNENEFAGAQSVAEEGNVEFGDGKGQNSNAFMSDSNVKEKEVARGRRRVLKEGMVGFRDGRDVGVKLETRNAMVVDSSPKLVYDSRTTKEAEGTNTVLYETRRNEEEEFNGASAMEEGQGGGGRENVDVEAAKLSFKRKQEGSKTEVLFMAKAALWLRILGLAMCVISFSIMATNKNNGWALDSFDQYQEFRYCMAVSILGFVYSLAQAFDVAYRLSTFKYSYQHGQVRYYLDFFMDQALSYLLISASSSAATRVEDWVSNWGKDKFPHMASVSVIFSFLAFGSFAFSSLVSGYILCSISVS